MKVQIPLVHLNGTARCDLSKSYLDAAVAVHAALGAVAKSAPNGRDYYKLDAGAMARATEQHERRCRVLRNLFLELDAISLAIDGDDCTDTEIDVKQDER